MGAIVMAVGAVARAALWTAVAAHLLVVEYLFIRHGQGKNQILTVGKFFGLHLASIMMLQLVLVARLPWLDRRIGMDRLTVWHRWIGFGLVWTLTLHFTFIIAGYADLASQPPWDTFLSLAGVTASLLGMIAAAVILVVASVSIRYVRRRLPYEAWHGLHLLIYVALGIGLVHQALEGTTFDSTWATVYWWSVWGLVLAALLTGRLLLPLWRNVYHRFRVAAVIPESDNVVSVHVTGRHLDKLPARAGSSSSGGFPDTTAGGGPTRSRSPQPPTAGHCASPRRPSGRAAPRCATCRSAAGSSSRGRTARSPPSTRPAPRRCSSPAASASPRSARCWRSRAGRPPSCTASTPPRRPCCCPSCRPSPGRAALTCTS
ncbi:hypothetical protein Psuf_085730 [Phytohabitans suffuscus]|uniref:Ferric oxidoreductase domain-containing protein n=1 Tax=Phytohabitans suffuscus TaxID=624315 RepID=A0A6F8YYK1_9ACTN|nr:hypothetical protein Psuf_085730 [Phytohabitans suffuscus]